MPSSTGSSQPRDRTQGSNPGLEPRFPALQVNSLPFETPGKPKNTGLGSLSLLQGILLTQELNQGLLHCRQILYQQSCQGSPYISGYRASNRDNYTHHVSWEQGRLHFLFILPLSLQMVLLELFYIQVWYANVTYTSVCSLSRISYLSIQCWWWQTWEEAWLLLSLSPLNQVNYMLTATAIASFPAPPPLFYSRPSLDLYYTIFS